MRESNHLLILFAIMPRRFGNSSAIASVRWSKRNPRAEQRIEDVTYVCMYFRVYIHPYIHMIRLCFSNLE